MSSGQSTPLPVSGHPSDNGTCQKKSDMGTTTADADDVMDAVHPPKKGAVYIAWEPNDPENPKNWPLWLKWRSALTVMTFSFTSACMSSGYGLAYTGVNRDLGPISFPAYESGITVYLLGIAFAPMLLAPFSESYGRYPVMMFAATFNFILFLGQTLAPNVPCIVITRLIQGCVGSVGNSMSGGYFADMFDANQRGFVLSIYGLSIFMAQSFGPVYASWIVLKLNWRWVFWVQMIACGVSLLCFVFFLKEVRGDILLSRRAKRLTKETGVEHRTREDDNKLSFRDVARTSLVRPVTYLFTEPIIVFYSLWIGFAWACSYLLLSAIPLVFAQYGWNVGEQNLPQLCTFIGVFLSLLFNTFYQERMFRRDAAKSFDGKAAPESRLYGCSYGAFLFPIGAFMFAWTGQPSVPWPVPCIALIIINFGIFSIYLSAYTYLSDSYERYASSALAAQSCFRNAMAAFFPLFSKTMYMRMGYPYASTVLACVAVVLGILPFVLRWKGPVIRSKSHAAMALAREFQLEEERMSARHQALLRQQGQATQEGVEKTA